ncbi:Nucleotide-binding, alpha-beta plait [Ostreococcus tauri]|uniref:Nucleotide-binding, alpha-beta plait n=1 Tax=Ostreococcus tauri TaxID=70448 RepID=Q01GM4_OSTTA|nr:Nucleotide-binding, alpha-beta plait [Ostreococcus tauri]CAL50120.1 Nucleotide-binding, alpha-beta plait [Ostreococcus tauri]|eukprot:XP_003074269.1 Nucleotide-binding, alpha-beta plait [Ostreococcus tauri]
MRASAAEAELRRKYELLRKKREAKAARELERASGDGGSKGGGGDGGKLRGGEASARGVGSGFGGARGGIGARVGAAETKSEPVDPAIERAKAILAGLHKKKQPGVAALNAKEKAEKDENETIGSNAETKKPKLVFTMSKREMKATPVMVDDDGPIGYASTVVQPVKAPEPVVEAPAMVEAPAVVAPEPAPVVAPIVVPAPVPVKKEIKRPGLLKRSGLLSPEPAKRAKLSAPTPFPDVTDGVGERVDKKAREVWIGDLPEGCTVEMLSLAAYRYGRVNSCRVIERKGFGFVTFADGTSAEKIVNASVAHFNDPEKEPVIVDGRIVRVDFSDERGSGGDKGAIDLIRQRAAEELERIRDGEIVDEAVEYVKRDVVVYDDI